MLGQGAGWGHGEAGVGGAQEGDMAHSGPSLQEATARRERTGGGCWGRVMMQGWEGGRGQEDAGAHVVCKGVAG